MPGSLLSGVHPAAATAGGSSAGRAMAAYGIAVTHNMFSIDRARAARASELRANGVSDTSVDNGWECNFDGARLVAEGQVLCCAEKRGD